MHDIDAGTSGPESHVANAQMNPIKASDESEPPNTDKQKTASNAANLLDEVQELKAKLSKLEQQARLSSRFSRREGQPMHETDLSHDGPQDPPLAQMEEFRRRELCLYSHRKEWEITEKSKEWEYHKDSNIFETERRRWPDYGGLHYYPKDYSRPDPFDPSHPCSVDPRTSTAQGPDGFDHAIDFGSRRERLRQNFEWEMDRLFLVEETDKRRRAKIADDAAKRKRAETVAKAAQTKEQETDSTITRNVANTVKTELAKEDSKHSNQLRRLDWFAFASATSIIEDGECVIDILIGEPIANNNRDTWYGFSSARVRKAPDTGTQSVPGLEGLGKGPLAERIRIHSPLLQAILTKVLGEEVEEGKNSEFVLLRPFKSLAYREQALRDWCSALEKKFNNRPSKMVTEASHTSQVNTTAESTSPNGTSGPDQDIRHSTPTNDSTSLLATVQDSSAEPEGASSNEDRKDIGSTKDQKGEERKEGQEEESDDDDDGDQTDETRTEGAMNHLKSLLRFIDSEISPRRSYLESPECRKVYFSDLWYLFRPGMEVIESNGKQVYRVVKVTSARHRIVPSWQMYWSRGSDQKQRPPFSITCVYVDFDGKSLGPVRRSFGLPRFDGEREVTSLAVYPLRFHPHRRSDFSDSEWIAVSSLPEDQRLKAKLILRGKKFLEVAGLKQMYYAGPTLVVRDEVESQVVVDFETAFSVEEQHDWKPELEILMSNGDDDEDERSCTADCCLEQNVHDDQYVDDKQQTEYIDRLFPSTGVLDGQSPVAVIPRLLDEIPTGPKGEPLVSDDDLLIMSYRVFGFVLRSRKWAQLDLAYMTDLYTSDPDVGVCDGQAIADDQGRKTAFDRLVLEKGHKEMILSLTAQHFRDKESASGPTEQTDIVKGKGKGLIILLHGAPGVGKTSTAEGVAEVFKKPLFQITCGDLGTTAKEVESALETNFALANKWGCVLLLDEADVFLAQRTKKDFIRNGLVAVFLRVMEYYSGVLFLTTNRVGDFDEAFTSRIHVSLYYPQLNCQKTGEVFRINLDMIEDRFRKKKRQIIINRFDIGSFATELWIQAKWNGRQIRNACQTAVALAEYEAQGSSYNQILKPDRPDAVVELKVEHFKTVQEAYMEFTKYINELYGTSEDRRAKESRLRAMVSENDSIISPEAAKDAFAAAARAQPHASASVPAQGLYPPPSYPPAQGYQPPPPAGMQQQPSYYSQFPSTANPYPPQGHQQHLPGQMAFNQATMGANVLQGTLDGQYRGMQQPPPAHNPQQPPEQYQQN